MLSRVGVSQEQVAEMVGAVYVGMIGNVCSKRIKKNSGIPGGMSEFLCWFPSDSGLLSSVQCLAYLLSAAGSSVLFFLMSV